MTNNTYGSVFSPLEQAIGDLLHQQLKIWTPTKITVTTTVTGVNVLNRVLAWAALSAEAKISIVKPL